MGVEYIVQCFYGVIFTYEELSKIDIEYHEDIKNAAGVIGCEFPDELSNIWEEMGNSCVYPRYNPPQEEIIYVYGEEYMNQEVNWGRTYGIITDYNKLQGWYEDNKEMIEKKVSDFCQEYGLRYRPPDILMLLSVL